MSTDERRSKSGTPGLLERRTKSGELVYVAIWRDESGKQRERVCRDEQTGAPLNQERSRRMRERWLIEAEDQAQPADRGRIPRLATYFATWRTTYRGRTNSEVRTETRFAYAGYIELHAMPIVGELRVTEITPRHLSAIADGIRSYADDPEKREAGRTRSAKTVSNRIQAFKVLVASAAQDANIANPLLGTRVVQPQPQLSIDQIDKLASVGLQGTQGVGALTPKQLVAFFTHVPPLYRLLLWLIATTGMRVSEAVGLVWADIDFDHDLLRLTKGYAIVRTEHGRKGRYAPTKTKQGKRPLPLTRGVVDELRRLRATRPNAGELTLIFPRNGEPIDRDHLNKVVVKHAMRAINVPWGSTKTLRHTFATLMHDRVSDKVLQLLMGHHDADYTRRTYQHLEIADQHPVLEDTFASLSGVFDAPYARPEPVPRVPSRRWTYERCRTAVLNLSADDRAGLTANGYKQLQREVGSRLPSYNTLLRAVRDEGGSLELFFAQMDETSRNERAF